MRCARSEALLRHHDSTPPASELQAPRTRSRSTTLSVPPSESSLWPYLSDTCCKTKARAPCPRDPRSADGRRGAVNGPPGGAGRRDRAYSRFRRRAAVPSSGATPGWRCSKIAVRSPRAGSAASRNCLSHRRGTAGLPTPPIRVPDARPSCGGWVPRAVALGASRRRRAPLPGAPPEVRIF
jgi:hypothetical protein